jgi:Fic family protein
MMECLDRFEHFLHDEKHKLPVLVEAGLIHMQFETIHPFLDGNGRLGRLLITLLLCAKGILREPLLYLSLYFKAHRQHYYDLLQRVRTEGVWEEWIEFFWKAPRLRLARQPTQPFKFFIFSKRTGKRFERWAARRRQAWPFTNTCKHIH